MLEQRDVVDNFEEIDSFFCFALLMTELHWRELAARLLTEPTEDFLTYLRFTGGAGIAPIESSVENSFLGLIEYGESQLYR